MEKEKKSGDVLAIFLVLLFVFGSLAILLHLGEPTLTGALVGSPNGNLSCIFEAASSCSAGTKVLGASNGTNAHVELANESNYTGSICCRDTSGNNTLAISGETTFLKLSAATNAHGEAATQTNYNFSANMSADNGDVSCTVNLTGEGNCSAGYGCVVTLSQITNAQIANCSAGSAYNITVCCILAAKIIPASIQGGTNSMLLQQRYGANQIRIYYMNTDDWISPFMQIFDQVKFDIGDEEHTLTLLSTMTQKIVVKIESTFRQYDIPAGNVSMIDVNMDDVPDLEISIEETIAGRVKIHMRKLLPTVESSETPEPTIVQASPSMPESTSSKPIAGKATNAQEPDLITSSNTSLKSPIFGSILIILVLGLVMSLIWKRHKSERLSEPDPDEPVPPYPEPFPEPEPMPPEPVPEPFPSPEPEPLEHSKWEEQESPTLKKIGELIRLRENHSSYTKQTDSDVKKKRAEQLIKDLERKVNQGAGKKTDKQAVKTAVKKRAVKATAMQEKKQVKKKQTIAAKFKSAKKK